jgi:hypothetical protein
MAPKRVHRLNVITAREPKLFPALDGGWLTPPGNAREGGLTCRAANFHL